MATHAEVEEDAARIAELVKYFEESKDWAPQEKVFEMLERIDHMHRICIWRVYELTTELGGKGLVTAGFDGTVRMYDLDGKMAKSFVPVPIEKREVAGAR